MQVVASADGRAPRVAVTGLGVICPAGSTVKEAVAALLAAESTASAQPDLIAGGSAVHFGCAVQGLDEAQFFSAKEQVQLDRLAKLALAAALTAVWDSEVDLAVTPARSGVFVGTGVGGLSWMERAVQRHGLRPDRMPAQTVLRVMNSSPAARISARLGTLGTSMTFATACASGASAIGEAADRIRHGQLDLVVAGGVEAPLSPLVVSAFAAMRALSRRNHAPASASRPFDDERDGFVMAEGATFLVLERMDTAIARGARIHGELLGYASNTDVCDLVAPSRDGAAAATSIRMALADAGLGPGDIGHISAHGTSTVLNDRTEATALATVFGSRCPPVTAAKGVVGHMIGAAGAFEAATGLVLAGQGLVPPVANFSSGRDADVIDLVQGQPRRIPVAPVLSTSFGFGGQNTCLILAPGTAC
jgi:3-oxoacyl-[acyl-carrier-protein] synthase II